MLSLDEIKYNLYLYCLNEKDVKLLIFIPDLSFQSQNNFNTSLSVHPCDRTPSPGCEHICHREGDKHECRCGRDFKLDDNKKTCTKSKYFSSFFG